MDGLANPRQNRLLAALSSAEFDRLHPDLERVWLPSGKVLHESGDCLQHVYFPVTAIVSLMYVIADGGSAEVALIGNDGMIGMPSSSMVSTIGLAKSAVTLISWALACLRLLVSASWKIRNSRDSRGGDTDRFGSESYNQLLSEQRAEAVKSYLVGRGIEANRITTEGKGETQPVTSAGQCLGPKNAKVVACLQADRRVDVEVTGRQVTAR